MKLYLKGWIKRICMFVVCGYFAIAAAGCASIDRVLITELEPIRSDANYEYFMYKSFADAIYPLDSEEAERTRVVWLEKWLVDNGYPNTKYEIVSRKAMLRIKGLFGTVYDIYYEVKVNK